MKHTSVRQVLLFLLGAVFALFTSAHVVASSEMALPTMASATVMADIASPDCQDSGNAPACQTDMSACALVCAGPVMLLPSQVAPPPHVAEARTVILLDEARWVGRWPPPDLSPPRATDIV
jgi:hypothetical protein